ncbi:MAG: hypothetical protein Q4F12_02400, partial [Erysipelotrichaceae bacterium]|nr:hypothetical protein [Erysipelotrichaceae bacterium]
VCNHTAPTEELLETIIGSSVKEIDFCGKFAGAWDVAADKVCTKHENDGSRPSDWCVLTCDIVLDEIINHIVLGGLFDVDDDSLKQIIVYDDETLKEFIIKRADQEAKITLEDDRYASEEEQQMSDEELEEVFIKERLAKERVELDFHTNKSKGEYVTDPYKAVWCANRLSLAGIAICDNYSVQGYAETQREVTRGKKRLKVLYGVNVNGAFVNNINVIAKNQEGKKAIYKYLTHCFTLEDKDITFEKDGITWQTTELQKIISDNRENLLIGLAYHSTAMAEALMMGKDADTNLIREDIADCDYVEIAPICTYKKYYPNKSDNEIKDAIKLIIDSAKQENKLVVATSAPQYVSRGEYLEYSILYEHNNHKKLSDDYDAHLYTTEEMKYAMDWLDNDKLVEEIVVTNTHKIMDMCDDFKPMDNTFHMPYIEDAYDKLESRVVKKMTEIYGTNVDRLITYRLETELKLIEDNGFAPIYMLAAGICDESRAQGYKYSYRGAIGASLVGYLLGISECNPLPPHTICPNCHRVVWNATVASGYDIEPHECRECGHIVKGEGQNIPYQTFMSTDGSRVPDIDLNLDPLFRENIVDVIKKVAPNNEAYRAGTANTIRYKDAAEMVSGFAGDDEGVIDNATREDLTRTISSVVVGQGKHPGGYIIVPKDVDINDITPLTKVDSDIVTHLEYHDISDNLYKVDCLEHADPAALRYMELLGLNLDEIDINDPKIYEMLNEDNGTLGIPELGSHYTSFILEKIKPKKFSDLVKISGFAHGTHVWTTNAEELFEKGMPLDELLATRDDVYNVLRFKYDFDENDAYKIMERVRKG